MDWKKLNKQERKEEMARRMKVRFEKRNHNKENLIVVGNTGATSSELNFDFHDLPYAGLLYPARRFHLGHYKHGRFNWTKGDRQFAEERLKHLMAHTSRFMTYRNLEDLDALLCNAMMICDFHSRGILSLNPRQEFLMEGKRNDNPKPRTRK